MYIHAIALIFITYIYTKPTPLGFFLFFSCFLSRNDLSVLPSATFAFASVREKKLRTASYYRWFFFEKKDGKKEKARH